MKRILADLPDDDVVWLDARAETQGVSRASLLREAVAKYRGENDRAGPDWLDIGFGLWKRCGLSEDPKEYERKRRAEWTRTWDDDYEEIRAESPDMFTEQDDRERAHYLRLIGKGPDGPDT